MKRPFRLLLPMFMLAATLASGDADAGAKAQRIPVSRISEHVVMVGGHAMVPLKDLAKATGCELKLVLKTDKKAPTPASYEAWPCTGGVLEVDVKMLKVAGKSAEGGGQVLHPTADPAPEQVITPKAVLRIDQVLVSQAIAVQGGDPHIPLAEVVRLMGGKLETKRGKSTIVVPRNAEGVLVLAKS